ncbi:MAG: hypothetical protein ACJA01_003916, partial [Saprospiraceae bacterium]
NDRQKQFEKTKIPSIIKCSISSKYIDSIVLVRLP